MNEISSNHESLLYKTILESPKGIVVFALDRKYCYTFFTPQHQIIMQKIWNTDIKIGMCILDAISNSEDREKAKNNFNKTLAGEYLLIREAYGDDKLFRTDWENRYSPLYDSTNTIIGLSVFVTDLTDQVTAERKIRDMAVQKAILRERELLLNSIGIGVYGLDEAGKCFFVNPAGLELLGYEEKELFGHDVHSIINYTKPDGAKYSSSERSADQSLMYEQKLDVSDWYRKKNGEIFPVHVISTPLVNQDQSTGVVVVFNDVTEEYNAKQKLATLQHDLFAALGHESENNDERVK